MLLLIISLYSSSIATSERSFSIWNNPAGLSFHSGIEMRMGSDSTLTFTFKRISYGLKIRGDSIDYITGGNYFTYKNIFSLGYAYSSLKRVNIFGIMYRPNSLISLGFTKELPSIGVYSAKFGIALKPFTDRITLYTDGSIDSTGMPGVDKIGIDLEPIDGVCLSMEKDIGTGCFNVGLHLAITGNIIVSGYANSDKRKLTYTDATFSYEPYPSLYKRRNRIVKITLKGDYPESPERTGLLGLSYKTTFFDLLQKLKYIKEQKSIKTLVINLKNPILSYAQIEELRHIIREIKQTKQVVFYSNNYNMKELYLASSGTKIVLTPSGEVLIPGVYIVRQYLKGTMEKLGIDTQFKRIGKYKSAVETFTNKHISEPDSIQYTAILDTIADILVSEIAKDRGISVDSLRDLINNYGVFNDSLAKVVGLVDTVMYQDEFENQYSMRKFKLGTKTIGRGFREDLKPKIAYYALEGDIVLGAGGKALFNLPFLGNKSIGYESTKKVLKRLREDKSIKAVVLRINSPGGDAMASELIWREIELLKEKKPVVVSMGDVAASGGYYISSPATKILADRMTITGSIGIFGGKVIMSGFYNKIGITYNVLKWGRHADAQSSLRPYTQEEMGALDNEIHYFYRRFLRRVSSGRGISPDSVNKIGRGRVWSGISGRHIGLVDANGGILDAIEEAKKLAGIKKYRVQIYGKQGGFFSNRNGASALSDMLDLINSPYLYLMPENIEVR